MRLNRLFLASMIACICASAIAVPAPPPSFGGHEARPEDDAAIRQLLDSYRAAVKAGDAKAFAALLLNDHVPFTGVSSAALGKTEARDVDIQRYADFRSAIFGSARRYEQRFDHVRILQDGALAQVSLDFVTVDAGTDNGGYGWKTLELLKVGGQWRIASEFYTGYPLPANPR